MTPHDEEVEMDLPEGTQRRRYQVLVHEIRHQSDSGPREVDAVGAYSCADPTYAITCLAVGTSTS